MRSLTERMLEICELLLDDLTTIQIADRLQIAPDTVKAHKSEIASRLGQTSARTIRSAYRRYKKTMPDHSEQEIDVNIFVGRWLSRFRYKTKKNGEAHSGIQYAIENWKKTGSSKLIGVIEDAVRTDGREPYIHKISAEVTTYHAFGTWKNVDTDHFGSFVLKMSNNHKQMSGYYIGVARDGFVRTDRWDWLRIGGQINLDSAKRIEFDKEFESALLRGEKFA